MYYSNFSIVFFFAIVKFCKEANAICKSSYVLAMSNQIHDLVSKTSKFSNYHKKKKYFEWLLWKNFGKLMRSLPCMASVSFIPQKQKKISILFLDLNLDLFRYNFNSKEFRNTTERIDFLIFNCTFPLPHGDGVMHSKLCKAA